MHFKWENESCKFNYDTSGFKLTTQQIFKKTFVMLQNQLPTLKTTTMEDFIVYFILAANNTSHFKSFNKLKR